MLLARGVGVDDGMQWCLAVMHVLGEQLRQLGRVGELAVRWLLFPAPAGNTGSLCLSAHDFSVLLHSQLYVPFCCPCGVCGALQSVVAVAG